MSNMNQSHKENAVTMMTQHILFMDRTLQRMGFFLRTSLHYVFPNIERLMLRHSVTTRKAAYIDYLISIAAAFYNVLRSLLQVVYSIARRQCQKLISFN